MNNPIVAIFLLSLLVVGCTGHEDEASTDKAAAEESAKAQVAEIKEVVKEITKKEE